jgi:hypothetical protein
MRENPLCAPITTGTVAAFLVHARRGWEALAALLGARPSRFIGSDRWSAYAGLSPYCRQVCWAHLQAQQVAAVARTEASRAAFASSTGVTAARCSANWPTEAPGCSVR